MDNDDHITFTVSMEIIKSSSWSPTLEGLNNVPLSTRTMSVKGITQDGSAILIPSVTIQPTAILRGTVTSSVTGDNNYGRNSPSMSMDGIMFQNTLTRMTSISDTFMIVHVTRSQSKSIQPMPPVNVNSLSFSQGVLTNTNSNTKLERIEPTSTKTAQQKQRTRTRSIDTVSTILTQDPITFTTSKFSNTDGFGLTEFSSSKSVEEISGANTLPTASVELLPQETRTLHVLRSKTISRKNTALVTQTALSMTQIVDKNSTTSTSQTHHTSSLSLVLPEITLTVSLDEDPEIFTKTNTYPIPTNVFIYPLDGSISNPYIDTLLIVDDDVFNSPCFGYGLGNDTWNTNFIQGTLLNTTTSFLDAIGYGLPWSEELRKTSRVAFEDEQIVRVCFGNDPNFPTDEFTFGVNVTLIALYTMKQMVPKQIVPSFRFLMRPTKLEKQETIKVAAKTLEVMSAATGALNPAAITSLQTTVMISMISCVAESVRHVANDASWSLAPLSGIAQLVPSRFANMVLWNVILFFAFLPLHYVVVRVVVLVAGKEYGDALSIAMFPHLSLTSIMMLYQGTTYAAYRTFTHYDSSPFDWISAVVPLVLICFGFPLSVFVFLRYKLHEAVWVPQRMASFRFSPRGVWGPLPLVSQYGLYFDETTPHASKWFKLCHVTYCHLLGAITAIQPSSLVGCRVQLGCLIGFTSCWCLCIATQRPFRWSILVVCRCFTLSVQVAQMITSGLVSATPDVEALVALLSIAAGTMEGFVTLATSVQEIRYYNVWLEQSLGGKTENKEEDVLSSSMNYAVAVVHRDSNQDEELKDIQTVPSSPAGSHNLSKKYCIENFNDIEYVLSDSYLRDVKEDFGSNGLENMKVQFSGASNTFAFGNRRQSLSKPAMSSIGLESIMDETEQAITDRMYEDFLRQETLGKQQQQQSCQVSTPATPLLPQPPRRGQSMVTLSPRAEGIMNSPRTFASRAKQVMITRNTFAVRPRPPHHVSTAPSATMSPKRDFDYDML